MYIIYNWIIKRNIYVKVYLYTFHIDFSTIKWFSTIY